jgi:hypothetical protein
MHHLAIIFCFYVWKICKTNSVVFLNVANWDIFATETGFVSSWDFSEVWVIALSSGMWNYTSDCWVQTFRERNFVSKFLEPYRISQERIPRYTMCLLWGTIWFIIYFYNLFGLNPRSGTRWRSWLRHCVTSRKVAGLIPDGVIGTFRWHNLSGRIIVLRSAQPLTE